MPLTDRWTLFFKFYCLTPIKLFPKCVISVQQTKGKDEQADKQDGDMADRRIYKTIKNCFSRTWERKIPQETQCWEF